MDANTKAILGTSVGLGASTLAVKSAKMLNKKVSTKDLIKNSTDLMIGTSLLSATSNLIN